MKVNPTRTLALESLADRVPVIPQGAAGFYKQNCMICFHHNSHKSGVKLTANYRDSNPIYEICWSGEVTDQLVKCYADLRRSTDNAACAIALLLLEELTEFTGVEQARTGTTIDYYLTPQSQDNNLIFNRAARLEVSGILEENENNTIDGRIRKKLRRLDRKSDLPAFIIIVEFSQPRSKMVKV